MPLPPPKQCFLSYAHADHVGFQRLVANLKPYADFYGFRLWYDRTGVMPGSAWHDGIQAAISGSQIFVLLTSNDFLGSDYVRHHELPAIIERHRSGEALVVPVIYKFCGWKFVYDKYIQAVPAGRDGRLRPVRQWPDRDGALAVASDAIAGAIRDWFGLQPPDSPFGPRPGGAP